MKKYTKFVMMLLMFSSFASFGYAADNKTAPGFQLMDLNEKTISLSDYKGKKSVILLFWTTWCPYCREELKVLNREHAGLSRSSMEILAVNVGEPKSKVDNFIRNFNPVFKVLLDRNGDVADAYELMGVPSYFVINKAGQIVSAGNHFPKDALKELTGSTS